VRGELSERIDPCRDRGGEGVEQASAAVRRGGVVLLLNLVHEARGGLATAVAPLQQSVHGLLGFAAEVVGIGPDPGDSMDIAQQLSAQLVESLPSGSHQVAVLTD